MEEGFESEKKGDGGVHACKHGVNMGVNML